MIIHLITLYQKILSPQTGWLRFLYLTPLGSLTPGVRPGCRFHPTCSEYAKNMFTRYSFHRALILSARRILKCHSYST